MPPFDALTPFETKPEVVSEPWRQVLLDAADLGERYGVNIYRHPLRAASGRGCTITLVMDAASHQAQRHDIALKRLAEHLGIKSTEVAAWNDSRKDASEVIAALRECAHQ